MQNTRRAGLKMGQFLLFENWRLQAKGEIWVTNMSGTPDPKPLLQSTIFNQVSGASHLMVTL
jgi:hypothetical protein